MVLGSPRSLASWSFAEKGGPPCCTLERCAGTTRSHQKEYGQSKFHQRARRLKNSDFDSIYKFVSQIKPEQNGQHPVLGLGTREAAI